MENDLRDFGLILKRLEERFGIDFSRYRTGTIHRRMARRMLATGAAGYEAYLSYIEKNPEEYERLLMDLTIKVSRFFRNEPLFDYIMEELLPELLGGGKGRRGLRVWSAGCAFGEEVYSVVILIMEYLRKMSHKVEDYRFSIFGTDIDDYALAKARTGEYDANALRETRPEILDRYFSRIRGPGLCGAEKGPDITRYRVVESVRNLASFCKHDLTSKTRMSPPSGVVANYDLILCRNLLIYFSRGLQQRAFLNLINSLNPGGYLVLGKSESIPEELEAFLVPQNSSRKVFRKLGGTA